MTHEADLLVDRRRLKRRLTLWRTLTIVLAVVAVLVGAARVYGFLGRDHIARLTVDGLIVADPARTKALAEIAEDPQAQALIVHIDSPGGTFVGGETLYHALREVAQNKPVAAVMGTVATSAGYMAAIAADRVFAHRGTITGSIGVMVQTADITGLLDKLGVSTEAIKSGPLKAEPSPLEPLSEEARAATRAIVDDMHALFTEMVAKRRDLNDERVKELADGRVYSGHQAISFELVDAIGGEAAARRWLAEEKGLPESLGVRDIELGDFGGAWLPRLSSLTENMLLSERLILDGVVSLWQPRQN